MPEYKSESSCSSIVDEKAKKDNAASQALVPYKGPQEAVEIIYENKMTNTEVANKDIYFGYPCRRRSCALTITPAPCVNKIISHIDGLEFKIQEHLKRFETALEEWVRISSTKASKEWSIDTQMAEVKPEERDKCPELKKEIETLLAEAIHLIKSLETDRAEAEDALLKQKLRREKLSVKIDSWSIWRLQKIPLAVQKEHDAFLKDIVELQRDIENKTHKLKYLQEQKENLETYNEKIQADIEYMRSQVPLLLKKQRHEFCIIEEQYRKKYEAVERYEQINYEIQEVTEHYENVKLKAKQVKEESETDIEDDELSLIVYEKDIQRLDKLIKYYSESAGTLSVRIEKKEERLSDTERANKTITQEIHTLVKVLQELKKEYEQLTLRKKVADTEFIAAFNDYHATKRTWDIEVSEVEKDYEDLAKEYITLKEEIKKLIRDIEVMARYVNDSIRTKADIESEIHVMLKMVIKNDQLHKYLHRKAYEISALYHITRYKLEDLEEKIVEVRRKFKGREEFLKKRIRAIVAHGLRDQKKLLNIGDYFDTEKLLFLKRKRIYSELLKTIEEPMDKIREQAAKIRETHQEHFMILSNLLQKRDSVKKSVELKHKNLQEIEKKTRDSIAEEEDKQSAILKEIQTTLSKITFFQTKVNQLETDLEEMEREKECFAYLISNSREKLVTNNYKKEQTELVFGHLLQEKKICEKRISEEEQKFKQLFSMRNKTLANIKEIQSNSLNENLRLAQEYVKLQNTFFTVKSGYLSQRDRQFPLDNAIADKTQLCELQKSILKVWQKHFELVILYSQVKLARFQSSSQESVEKILAVQILVIDILVLKKSLKMSLVHSWLKDKRT
ncbi:coiled-coil domain-containing protein 178 [Sorex araneus]|uniref:coiled-coil domain-containing protein 178 n=1 Tax=Sorex araneus TaxID=42254 RepID=UPI00243355CC|nr:coiled-coil domain-containing protein 178 [Sorex araneus]